MKRYAVVVCLLIFIVSLSGFALGATKKEARIMLTQSEDKFFLDKGKNAKIDLMTDNVDVLNVVVYRLSNPPIRKGEIDRTPETVRKYGVPVYRTRVVFNYASAKKAYRWKDPATGLTHWQDTWGEKATHMDGSLRFPLPSDGIYAVELSSGNTRRMMTLIATPLSMVIKNTRNQAAGFVYNQRENRPVANASIKLYTGGKFAGKAVTRSDGTFIFNNVPLSDRMTILAEASTKTGARAYDLYSYKLSPEEYPQVLYLYTDRPIYRPGHEVFFRGIAGIKVQDGQNLLTNTPVTMEIRDAKDAVVHQGSYTTGEFGSYSGGFTLPEDAGTGFYTVKTVIDNKSFYDSFKVDVYRKPEFKVTVMPADSFIIQGQPTTVKAKAIYYTGHPVGNVDFTYRVEASPAFFYPSITADNVLTLQATSSRQKEFVAEGSGRTDAEGVAEFSIPARRFREDRVYRVTVTVTDANNRSVDGSGSLFAFLSTVRIGLKTDQRVVKKGEPVDITVFLRDPANKGVAGTVQLALQKAVWNPRKREFAYVTVAQQTVEVGETGEQKVSIPVDKPGRIRIYARVKDTKGRVVVAQAFYWVEGAMKDAAPSFEIVNDRVAYEPGENAKVFINATIPGVWAYVSLEGDRVYRTQVVHLKNSSATITLPIEKEYSPNVFLHTSYIYRGQYVGGSTWIQVPSKEKFLKVAVSTDKEVYEPGDEATYTITVRDNNNNPVRSEVSLGVVDEAIYALRSDMTPDIFDYFHGKRRNSVITGYSVPREYTGGSYQKVEKQEEVKTRENFKDTAYWNPSIVTGEDGTATVKVPLADNLTTWRATCRAVNGVFKVGNTTDSVIAKKDLLVRLGIPRYLVAGDEVVLTSLIQNFTTEPHDMKNEVKVEGVRLTETPPGQVRVRARDSRGVNFKVKVPADSGGEKAAAVIHSSAVSEIGKGDAVTERIPILPRGIERHKYTATIIKDTYQESINLPSGKQGAKVRLRFAPTLLAGVIGSLDYLVGYPYGCVEQTMSRFYPDLAVLKTMEGMGVQKPAIAAKMPEIVRQSLGRLYGYQHADGGWGWWKADETNPYMTAYVMEGLKLTRETGYTVDQEVFNRGTLALKTLYGKQTEAGLKAYMLYVLAKLGAADVKQAEELTGRQNEMDTRAIAYLALALQEMGKTEQAATIVDELRKQAITGDSHVHWKNREIPANKEHPIVYWSAYGPAGDIEATALALRAMVAAKKLDDTTTAATLRWLLLQKEGNYWASTKTTSVVLLTIADYLAASGEMSPNYRVAVSLNGAPMKDFVVGKDNATGETVVDIPAEQLDGKNTLRVTKEGTGNLYLTTELAYFDTKLVPEASGIKVEKKYYVSDGKGGWAEAGNGLVPLGEDVLVSIVVTPDAHYTFAMVEDQLPSGAEIQESKMPEATAWERKKDNVVAFFRAYLNSPWKLEYVVRMERPGTFTALPAQATLMYRPEVYGISNHVELVVKDR